MGKTKVTDFFVYRYRYVLGYSLLTLIIASLLFVVGVLSPGGISLSEQHSAVTSHTLQPLTAMTESPSQLINAPYHLLQKVSFNLFGVSALSIKLPSLILGGLAIFALHGLLRLWFRKNVALITSVIAASTGLFLFTAQEGTPGITYFFLNVTLLWTVSMLTRGKGTSSLWLVVAAIVAAYSLYSPLQIYIVVGLVITCLVHPHARFVVFRRPLWALITSGVAFLLLISPLIVGIAMDPSVIKALLGVPSELSALSPEGLALLRQEYLGFWQPFNGSFIAPAYSLGLILLALIGLYRLLTAKYTAKSYILTIWLILTIPITLLVPQAAAFTLLPTVLLIAFAIDYLIRSWYRLFPINPYARVAGLLPLAALMVGLSVPCIERMIYGYHYSPAASGAFSRDISLLDAHNGVLVVPDSDKAFYQTYAEHRSSLKVVSSVKEAQALQAATPSTTLIVERTYRESISAVPTDILVGTWTNDAGRFYLYTTASR